MMVQIVKKPERDFPRGPVVKTLPSSAEGRRFVLLMCSCLSLIPHEDTCWLGLAADMGF